MVANSTVAALPLSRSIYVLLFLTTLAACESVNGNIVADAVTAVQLKQEANSEQSPGSLIAGLASAREMAPAIYAKLQSTGARALATDDFLQTWKAVQATLLKDMGPSLCDKRILKVLVVVSVFDEDWVVEQFKKNLNMLSPGNVCGDIFEFALHHVDGKMEKWKEHGLDVHPSLMHEVHEKSCKADTWLRLHEKASDYDYIWLLDQDVDLSPFSWDLYRTFLLRLDPLVSQPAIVGNDRGARASDWPRLNMKPLADASSEIPIARKIRAAEPMATFISSAIWESIHEVLQRANRTAVTGLVHWWNFIAHADATRCSGAGVLVLDASPVVHTDRHTIGQIGTCTTGCVGDNCSPYRESEAGIAMSNLQTTRRQRCRGLVKEDFCLTGNTQLNQNGHKYTYCQPPANSEVSYLARDVRQQCLSSTMFAESL